MPIENFICANCDGAVEIKGYMDKYFICVICGKKNNVKKVKK